MKSVLHSVELLRSGGLLGGGRPLSGARLWRVRRGPQPALVVVSVLVIASGAGSAGCRGWSADESPVVPIRNMHSQDRYDPQAQSDFFGDSRTMRPDVPHTVPREAEPDPRIRTGVTDGGYVMTVPEAVTSRGGGLEALAKRGHQRFDIYCRPCHDGTGSGKGLVIERNVGMVPPPSFHDPRIQNMPDGQLFATITNGVRNMPPYGPQIPVDDRWAIVAYVRALQLSQATGATP